MNYKTKAKALINSGFWVAGYGHFDITIDELAKILKMIDKEDFKGIRELYKELEKERL